MRLQPGEKVLLEMFDVPDAMVSVLIEEVVAVGAIPFVELRSNSVQRTVFMNATETMMQLSGAHELERMKQMDAYVAIRGAANAVEFSDVPAEKMRLYQELWLGQVQSQRINNTKWVVLFPSMYPRLCPHG
jgi:aminopeptidase